jgi:hypothetical protein
LHTTVRAAARHAALGALLLGTTLTPIVAAPAAAETPAAAGGAAPAHQDAAAPASDGQPALRAHVAAARLVVRRHRYELLAGSSAIVRGTLLPRRRGERVRVEGAVHGRWRVLARTRTRRNGHFSVRVALRSLGTIALRVRFRGDRIAAAASARAGALRGFRPTVASWYALYGSPLACGGTLGYEQLGVANRTLPCGTRVTLRYHGRSLTVPVIDRGPYVGGREWDLTGATARRLGFDGVGVVWSTR